MGNKYYSLQATEKLLINPFTFLVSLQKNKFYIKDLVKFTEEILNGKFHFLCSEFHNIYKMAKKSIEYENLSQKL